MAVTGNGEHVNDVPVQTPEVTFSALKPQLRVTAPKAHDAIQFYKAAFGAVEISRTMSKRKADQELPHVISAQLQVAGSTIIVSDVPDEAPPAAAEPLPAVASGIVLCIVTNDVEAAVSKAVEAGAVLEGEITEHEDACCGGGGRVGKVKDPHGFIWHFCSGAAKNVDA